jgi:putative ABC transport system permease protein
VTPRVPRLARWILGRLAPPGDARFLLDDLAEEHGDLASSGRTRAWLWYWSQTLRSVSPLLAMRRRDRQRMVRQRRLMEGPVANDLWWQDVVQAMRRARVNKLLSAAVIATMALGIGATTAIFTVARDVVFDPLPLPNPEQLVRIENRKWQSVSVVDVRDRAQRSRTLQGIVAFTSANPTLTGRGEAQRLNASLVSERFGEIVGIRPLLGRTFRPEEHVFGGRRAVLLTYALWQRQFGGDPAIVGRAIRLDGEPHEVVGVLPAVRFQYPLAKQEIWLPLIPQPESWQSSPGSNWLQAVARLRPGVTPAQAQAEMDAATPRLVKAYGLDGERDVDVVPLQETVVGPIRPVVLLIGAIVVLVLLIACSNIASLLLADAEARRRELAIRSVLGGGGRRLARQVLLEQLTLALAGGVVAVLVAFGMVRALLALYPGELPRAGEVRVDGQGLLLTLSATLMAALLASLPAVLRALRIDVGSDVRAGERGLGSPTRQRARALLVAGQVALSVLLLVGAGLLLKSFWRLLHVEPGYRTEGILTFNVSIPSSRYDSDEKVVGFYDQLLPAVRSIPGVTSAGAALGVPMTWGGWTNRLVLEGHPEMEESGPDADVRIVSPGYLETMGIPVLEGRAFRAEDRLDAPPVVLVNQRAVREGFGGRSPIGRRIEWDGRVREIVGVVGDTHQHSLTETPPIEIYSPASQIVRLTRYVAVRTDRAPGEVVAALRTEVAKLDPTVAVSDVATMDERLAKVRAPARFRATLTCALGSLALLLAMLGIYSSMAYAVRRQTRDIGIRLALGAAPTAVRREVILRAFAIAATGASIGVTAASATSHLLATFFFDVAARDAWVFAGAPALLLTVALAAAYGPARWASRIQPSRAMRAD